MFDKLSKAQVNTFYAAHGILPRRKGQRFDISFANHYGIWITYESVVAAIPTLLLSPCGNAENAEYLVCNINGRLVPAYRFVGKMACQLRSYKAA